MREFAVNGEQRIDVAAEPIDVHFGSFRQIDLVKIDVEGGEEQVLAGMERLMAQGVVQRVCFELIRDRMGDDWAPLIRRLRSLDADGWRFAVLTADGVAHRVALDEILSVGHWPQVVMEQGGH